MVARYHNPDDPHPFGCWCATKLHCNWFHKLWAPVGLVVCGPSPALKRLLRQPSAFVSLNAHSVTYC
eukprot:4677539-Lingulodinium_polyedra.AAC.1